MPSVRDIRRRIRSVENTSKVTNAMSLIAASKMRRAQQAVTQGRPFAEKIQDVITHLAPNPRTTREWCILCFRSGRSKG